MREAVLVSYFRGRASSGELESDLSGAMTQTGRDVYELRVEAAVDGFVVQLGHLIQLCEDVERGEISPEHLESIGFAIIASDQLEWPESPEGERMSEVLYDWSAPTINYALTRENARKWRTFLQTGRRTFTRADLSSTEARRPVIETRYKSRSGDEDGR